MIKIILEINEDITKYEDLKNINVTKLDVDVKEESLDETEQERRVANILHKRINQDEVKEKVQIINDCNIEENRKRIDGLIKLFKRI